MMDNAPLSGAASLPILHVTQSEDGLGSAGAVVGDINSHNGGTNSWLAGLPLPADRPVSALSGTSTPWSSHTRRSRPHSSLGSLAQPSSQQMHQLRTAAVNGATDQISKILDSGICVDQTLRQGWTAMLFACSTAQPAVVKLLLERGADPNRHKELFTPLMAACSSSASDYHYGKSLLHASTTDLNNSCGDNDQKKLSTVLSTATAEERLLACCELLLTAGGRVSATERHKMSPLMFAAKSGRIAVVRRLLKEEVVMVSQQDNKGWTALCWACHGGDGPCVRELLSAGSDPSLATCHGQTPADIARSQNFLQLAEVVDAAALGAPINAPTSSGPVAAVVVLPPVHCSDLDMVLAGLEMSHLANIFAKHRIDLAGFLRLTADDLTRLGIREVGLQRRLLAAVAEMHRKAWQPSSIATITTAPYISLVDATSMLANVNKHVTFLEATLSYLREQLESSPASQQLHHNTTDTTMATLVSTADNTAAAITRLHSTTLYLSRHLHKVSDCAVHLPSDVISSPGPDPPRAWSRSVGGAAALSAVVLTSLLLLRPSLLSAMFSLAPRPSDTVILDC